MLNKKNNYNNIVSVAKQPALFSSNRIETEADRQAAGEGFVIRCTLLVLSGNKKKKTKQKKNDNSSRTF